MTIATGIRACCFCATIAAATAAMTVIPSAAPADGGSAGQTSTATRPAPLFMPATRSDQARPDSPARHIIRHAALTISEKALAAGAIQNADAHLLNLFPDVEIAAMRTRVESHTSSDYTWFGSIVGDGYGRVIINVTRGRLSAVVTQPGKRYVVQPAPGGIYEVLEIDEDSFPETDDGEPLDDGKEAGASAVPSGTARQLGATPIDTGGLIHAFDWRFAETNGDVPSIVRAQDDGSVVDVLFLYTHEAALATDPAHDHSLAGSPHVLIGQIGLATGQINGGFRDSGIQTEVQRTPYVPLELRDFVETDDSRTNLYRLRNSRRVAEWRETYAADLVVLVTLQNGEDCGRGQIGGAFSVVKVSCLISFTVPHEIGHNFGALHDWYTFIHREGNLEPDNWTNTFEGHGFVQIPSWEKGYRTNMAYHTYCTYIGITCKKINRWSDPNAFTTDGISNPLGLPLGIPQGLPYPADDAGVLNDNRVRVANNRLSICRLLSGC